MDDAARAVRIVELESELAAARKAIEVLLDKAEREYEAKTSSVGLFEAAARLEQLVGMRTKEVEEKSAALEEANAELRNLTDNLDKIVRQRNRALVESEAQLRKKNEELKKLNTIKSEFISIAAHELRTPLTSIVGYVELMSEGKFGELPSGAAKPLGSVLRNVYRLMRLVEEMLDVSRIEGDKVQLRREACDLGQLVGEVANELKPLATTKKQSLNVEFNSEPIVSGDSDKIHQIVSNLIANAIRYTQENGVITAMVDRAPEDQYAGNWARLRVRDNGIGIPKEHLGRIFDPFSEVTPVRHHTSSGPNSAGLGLYIARGLVDLHGGLISVESQEGKGTEFTVLLPLISGG